jgi:hypothetical protein
MSDELELDQEDFKALLDGDAAFTTVTVLKESRGDIEADVLQALGALNQKASKAGAVAVVLQPIELPSNPDTANPELRVRVTVQILEQQAFNAGDTGTGKDMYQLARRVRQLCHRRNFGRGLYNWVGTEDAQQDDASRRSRLVIFEKRAQEDSYERLGAPLIDPEAGGAAPQEVTLTPPAGATAYYTIDGSLPVPGADGTTEYTGAFTVAAAATLRAMAYKSGSIPSNVAEATFT